MSTYNTGIQSTESKFFKVTGVTSGGSRVLMGQTDALSCHNTGGTDANPAILIINIPDGPTGVTISGGGQFVCSTQTLTINYNAGPSGMAAFGSTDGATYTVLK